MKKVKVSVLTDPAPRIETRSAAEIRKWQIGIDRLRLPPSEGGNQPGELFFERPKQPSARPGQDYLRCAGEQRAIVETEIAAQLAELNQTLRDFLALLKHKYGYSGPGPFGG